MSEKISDARRQAAFRFGMSAEGKASLLFNAKGYREIARRWKSPVGEIDLIMKRGKLIVFVEVKARGRLDDAAEAVLIRQRRRIVAAAGAWLAVHPGYAGYDMRFDAVLVAPKTLPRHIESAFESES